MSQIIESTITTTPSTSITTSLEPKPDVPKETNQSETISELFRTKSPNEILPELHQLGFKRIKECRCCPQFSRSKNNPLGNHDAREIVETELPKIVAQKFKTEEPLTILTIGPGQGFSDLVELSKFREKGFTNITWILVDPIYSKGEDASSFSKELGQKTLEQIKQIAASILPGIKIHVIESIEEIAESTLASTTDVFIDFDDGMLGKNTAQEYDALVQTMEKYIHSLSKPVIYLHSDKSLAGYFFNKQTQSIQATTKVIVSLQYISPEDEMEPRILVNSTMPDHTVCANQDLFIRFINSDDYDAVEYCIKKGCNPHFLQENLPLVMSIASKGLFHSLKALVEAAYISPTAKDNDGRTVLHHAACNKSPNATEIIDYLVEKGADINAQNKYKMTPLFDAASLRRTSAILALLKNGARLDIEDHMGRTPLPWIQELLQTETRSPTEADHFRQIRDLIARKTGESTQTTIEESLSIPMVLGGIFTSLC
jgi:hypothetical protein